LIFIGRPKRQRRFVSESPQNALRANGIELAAARRYGKRSDGVTVAIPGEQHGEADAAVWLMQVVQGTMTSLLESSKRRLLLGRRTGAPR
jgi:hypothetical protein